MIGTIDHRQLFASPWTPENPHYRYQVVEEQPIGTILTTVQATDADSTIAEYRMTENSFFEIHNTTADSRRDKATAGATLEHSHKVERERATNIMPLRQNMGGMGLY
uniref:Cadherin domain-containing protein n=1 Tax=Anopheles maculatus TaxID=74869 RepID=A0A182TCC3_9DIPT